MVRWSERGRQCQSRSRAFCYAARVKLVELGRIMGLLSRISRGRRADEAPDEERRTPGGVLYDLYLPERERRGAVVAVHGVTLRGGRDQRLVHFARSLARSQIACAVPTLPALGSCRLAASDLDAVEEVTLALAEESGERPGLRRSAPPLPGLVGFSYGGSYCLIAAARASLAARVRFVLSFGAYWSLEEVVAGYAEEQRQEPAGATAWDDRIYLHLVLAEQLGDELLLPGELREQVRDLLRRYCSEASPEEKRRFHDEKLRTLELAPALQRFDRATLRALSPAGQLGGLRCPASLIHDAHDSVVPRAQAEKLHAELQRSGEPERSRLLVTPLLSHVDLGSLLRVGQVGHLLAALAPLIES
jgi:pimeloyl-ACP methyl ester carboxylesterase